MHPHQLALSLLIFAMAACQEAPPLQAPAPPPTSVPSRIAAPASPEAPTPERHLVEALPEAALEDGCSCTFSFQGGDRTGYALSGEVTGASVRIQIAGETRTLIASGEPTVGAEGRAVRTYTGGNSSARLEVLSETPCAEGDEACEATGSVQKLTVTRGEVQEVLTVEGTCGC